MIDGKNVLHQPVKNDFITHENIRMIRTGQRKDSQLVVC